MSIAAPFSCDAASLPTVDEAIALVSRSIKPVRETEEIPLYKASARVLAADITAHISVPPFDRSAMDGFAFQSGSVGPLRRIGEALAGRPFVGRLNAGECVAIATGAALPAGCDSVAMSEHCRETPEGILAGAKPGAHIRRQGEDFRAGDTLAAAGTRLDARHIALLGAAGLSRVPVKRRLRVAVLSVGDELGESVPDGIHDANRVMLLSWCEANGMVVSDFGVLPDQHGRIAARLAVAASAYDMVITSAGTSAGDEDHMRGAILDCGGDVLVAGVAIRPGKPVTFGRIGNTLIAALPGNPVAAFVTFLVMGLPLLRHAAGETLKKAPWQKARADFSYRKKTGVKEYLRVTTNDDCEGGLAVKPNAKNGSAMLTSLTASDGLVCLGESTCEVTPGMLLDYRSFQEFMTS